MEALLGKAPSPKVEGTGSDQKSESEAEPEGQPQRKGVFGWLILHVRLYFKGNKPIELKDPPRYYLPLNVTKVPPPSVSFTMLRDLLGLFYIYTLVAICNNIYFGNTVTPAAFFLAGPTIALIRDGSLASLQENFPASFTICVIATLSKKQNEGFTSSVPSGLSGLEREHSSPFFCYWPSPFTTVCPVAPGR